MAPDGTQTGSSHHKSCASCLENIKIRNCYHDNTFWLQTRKLSSFLISFPIGNEMKWLRMDLMVHRVGDWVSTSHSIFTCPKNGIQSERAITRALLGRKKRKFVHFRIRNEMKYAQICTPHGRRSPKILGENSPGRVGTPRYRVFCLIPPDG